MEISATAVSRRRLALSLNRDYTRSVIPRAVASSFVTQLRVEVTRLDGMPLTSGMPTDHL